MKTFEHYRDEAEDWSLKGWDFSDLKARWHESAPHWDYRTLVIDLLNQANVVLDMGTGGGEFLASLPNLPKDVSATEAWPPNVTVARDRLTPLGIDVSQIQDDDRLPYPDNRFDLVINRHESFDPAEVFRILTPGGTFITQQVGARDNREINDRLMDTPQLSFEPWEADHAGALLEKAGFVVTRREEDFPTTRFLDIGALMLYLKAIPWQIPDFSIASYEKALVELHHHIEQTGGFNTKAHRFLLVVKKGL